jgi:hypothetical protein
MPDEGNGDFQLFEPLWRLPPQVALPKAVSGDTVNAPFRQQCESEAEWVLNNGEREFEPEQVAPHSDQTNPSPENYYRPI